MKINAECVAFVSLMIAATCLECFGRKADGLWFVIVVWAIFTDWGQKK